MDWLQSDKKNVLEILRKVANKTLTYLEKVDDLPAHTRKLNEILIDFNGDLPEEGIGAIESLETLLKNGFNGIINNAGPNCYHFVTGGSTPAALGADWFASVVDQPAFAWASSPLAVKLEALSLQWLQDLFHLPASWNGIIVTGATMANYTCLGAARQWYGEQLGVDISESGLSNLSQIPVFSSGYIHASSRKCLSMLGMGRSSLKTFEKDTSGKLDVDKLENALKSLNGKPAIIIANAGEVNTGDFDPVHLLANMSEKYNCWLHVDGAFGLFARCSPTSYHLAKGIERASSVTVDGHKWLNVPYDCGFAFVSDASYLAKTFHYTADYLPDVDDPKINYGSLGPESSRRARAFSVWATLMAYGRKGYQDLVEKCINNAQKMASLVDQAPEFERLAKVHLNIVCFRYNPGNKSEKKLDDLNAKLGEMIAEDGRVYAGTTKYKGMIALRPAIVNWKTDERNIEFFVKVVSELASKL